MIPMYFNMCCKITIGNIIFENVNSITIIQSIKTLSNTATIIIPREYKDIKQNGTKATLVGKNLLSHIKVGDSVKIELGYDNTLYTEFKGYINKISADIPLQIDCEDEMFKLRKTNFIQAFSKITLKQLLTYIAPLYTHKIIDDISLGKFTINNQSAYKVLEELRTNYGLHSHFEDSLLVVGFPISLKPQKVHEVNINRNVRAIKNDLKFVRKQDFKVLLKAISINKSGERLNSVFGEKGGAVRTLHFTNKTIDELKQLVERNYKSLSFDGYQGSLPMWGLPLTKAGDSVNITDPNYTTKNQESERNGKYLIEGVTIKFNGNDGYLRLNKLGLKL